MTALIGLAIIAIWLVVLVPMWLNRHDATDATRSMDSFSTAMRVLSRRAPSQGDRRYVVMPRRDNWGLTVDNNPDAKPGRRPGGSRRPAVTRGPAGAQARMLTRRRRVTVTLLAVVVVLFLTAAVGATSWWYEVAVLLGAAGYVIHLRGEAIRAREQRARRQARAARAAVTWASLDEPRRRRVVPEKLVDDEQVLPAEPVSAAGTENGSRWEPVPVPLPTYVSKPVATRPVASAPRADVDATNTIDLTRPGTWSEGRDGEASYVDAAYGGASSEPYDQYAPDVEIDHRHLLLDDTGSGRIASSSGVPAGAAAGSASSGTGGAGARRPVVFEDDELDAILERRAVGD